MAYYISFWVLRLCQQQHWPYSKRGLDLSANMYDENRKNTTTMQKTGILQD